MKGEKNKDRYKDIAVGKKKKRLQRGILLRKTQQNWQCRIGKSVT